MSPKERAAHVNRREDTVAIFLVQFLFSRIDLTPASFSLLLGFASLNAKQR
jgi:hypothetical protein